MEEGKDEGIEHLLDNNNQIALKPKGFGNWLKSSYTVIGLVTGVVTGVVALELGLGGFESLAIGAASTTIPKLAEGVAHLIEHFGGRLWSRKSGDGERTKDYQIGGSVAIKSVRNAIFTGGLAALGTELAAVINPEFVISKVATLPFLILPAMGVATVTFVGSVIYFKVKSPKAEQLRLNVPTQVQNQGPSKSLVWELTKTTAQGLILTAGAGVTLFFASRQAADQYIANQKDPTPEMQKLVGFTANAFAIILTEGFFILVQRRDFELDWRRTASKMPVLGGVGDEYTAELVGQNVNLLDSSGSGSDNNHVN